MPLNLKEALNKITCALKRGEEKVKTALTKPKTPAKKKAPSSSAQIAKRRSRGKIFLIIGIISILIGLFTLFPLIWGIPLTIAGIMMRRKEKRKGKREEKLPFLTWITEISPIDRLRTKFVSRHHVLGSWSYLIGGAQGRTEEVFKTIEENLENSGVSSIQTKRRKLMPGIIRGVFGKKRNFLVVKDKSFRLRPYQLLINARDYGNYLDISWYLTYRLSFTRALLRIIPFYSVIPNSIERFDLFDLQDLTAYNTLCHHATLEAVEKLMLSLNQDPSKIKREARGFLGIS